MINRIWVLVVVVTTTNILKRQFIQQGKQLPKMSSITHFTFQTNSKVIKHFIAGLHILGSKRCQHPPIPLKILYWLLYYYFYYCYITAIWYKHTCLYIIDVRTITTTKIYCFKFHINTIFRYIFSWKYSIDKIRVFLDCVYKLIVCFVID